MLREMCFGIREGLSKKLTYDEVKQIYSEMYCFYFIFSYLLYFII